MTEEKVETSQEVVNDNADYIEAIKNLKASSVDKAVYDKKVEENKKLLQALVQGDVIKPEIVTGPSKKELEDIMLHSNSNLDIAKASLKHRELVLEETGRDEYACGTTSARAYNPSAEQLMQAEQTAKILTELVEQADGDRDYFNTLLKKANK